MGLPWFEARCLWCTRVAEIRMAMHGTNTFTWHEGPGIRAEAHRIQSVEDFQEVEVDVRQSGTRIQDAPEAQYKH